jgi:hypothetical protein
MFIRVMNVRQLILSVPWLKALNAQGRDIFIRPQGSMGILLIDDLRLGAIDRLRAEGLGPALVTRTSEDNYQAWVRLSPSPLAKDLATRAAKLLAANYGGDPASADWRHFGRLAGFTNRKPERRDEWGRPPFVLLWEACGRLAPGGPYLLEKAGRRPFSPKGVCVPSRPGTMANPVGAFRQIVEGLRARYGSAFDPSRADWMAVQDLLRRGLAPDQVRLVMQEASPDLDQRKRGHLEDYCERTVAKALAALGGGPDR